MRITIHKIVDEVLFSVELRRLASISGLNDAQLVSVAAQSRFEKYFRTTTNCNFN